VHIFFAFAGMAVLRSDVGDAWDGDLRWARLSQKTSLAAISLVRGCFGRRDILWDLHGSSGR